ncbi:FAD-dependent oxidoreductase [Actinoplanes hulinensis]|uniref:FAD-dependent oxidoreductase n=1 Tax=Actinoplanes hulinensis TaxID=1144547 RepID=A0ABS7B4T7_9ACTN|nr:FAD-dependent oxidoreductase [Actinoplanes hulinensis]MBW6436051.1 FAD-dependent oxidoreductase [Actinoplanes hulinensis]
MPGPAVVIIGAGVTGCAMADELTARGWTDVTVLEQGPLFETGGSSSHTPGLVSQIAPSRTMTRLARYTAEKYARLGCYSPVGGLELATTPERLADLHRRHGFGEAWGVHSTVVDPAGCLALFPLLEKSLVLGGLHVPSDGLVAAVRAAETQAANATARGARFIGNRRVTDLQTDKGRITGVHTAEDEVFPADLVVSCTGFWGATARPIVPMVQQYVRTTAAGAGDSLPIVRHPDRGLYLRAHGDRLGIGSVRPDPRPVRLGDLPGDAHPALLPFTPDTFRQSWTAATDLIPALRGTALDEAYNGVLGVTADGFPLLGEAREPRGLWVAEAVPVAHSAGVAKALTEWIIDGRPVIDLHECDLNRFDPGRLAPEYVRRRAVRRLADEQRPAHPADPPGVRDLRIGPFHSRQAELGAVFGEDGGWEIPLWYASNPAPDPPVTRDEWSGRHWSPIAETEARLTRRRVGLFDLTPLTRIEVTGPFAAGADIPVGTIRPRGGVTVTRLAGSRFLIGANGPLDLDRLLRAVPPGVTVRDVSAGTCALAVWGPAARELLAPLTTVDLASFGHLQAREGHLGMAPVTLLRVSAAGELGWEIWAEAGYGPRLWDTLWETGRELGLVAAGRLARDCLRMEKGHRLRWTDTTDEDEADPERSSACLVLAETGDVPVGGEPVYAGGFVVGHVTSAAYGCSVGAPIAYAWLPSVLAVPGTQVEIGYFDRRLLATVTAEPLFDPKRERLLR